MTCAEVQDRLWEDDEGARDHARACAACRLAQEEIRKIRHALAEPAPSYERLSAGVLARMSVRPRRGGSVLRLVAGLLLGMLGGLMLAPARSAPPVVVERRDPERPFQRLLDRFASEPGFEDVLVEALNAALRRRSATEGEQTFVGGIQ